MDIKIYVSKVGSFLYVRFDNDEIIGETWLRGKFLDIKLLVKSKPYEDEFCYVLLKEDTGKGKVVELLNNDVLLEGFDYVDYKGLTRKETHSDDIDFNDYIMRFDNKRDKQYYLFSLAGKYIFGPYEYSEINAYRNGVILDKTMAVGNDGETINLSDYIQSESSAVYNSRDGKHSIILLDEEGCLFHDLEPCSSDKNKMSVVVAGYKHTYDKAKDEHTYSRHIDNSVWTNRELNDAVDIAYEGYSRLELGLD